MKKENVSVVKKIIRSVLEKGYLMSLATIDENGPWVSDVIFVSESDFSLFWISNTRSRHSNAILKNSKVAGTITLTQGPNEDDIGLQIEGIAEKLEGDNLERATQHRLKRKKPAPKKEGEILEANESWYKLKPTKIELIYSPRWGFTKQVVEMS